MGVSSGKRVSKNKLNFSNSDIKIYIPEKYFVRNYFRDKVFRFGDFDISIPSFIFQKNTIANFRRHNYLRCFNIKTKEITKITVFDLQDLILQYK